MRLIEFSQGHYVPYFIGYYEFRLVFKYVFIKSPYPSGKYSTVGYSSR